MPLSPANMKIYNAAMTRTYACTYSNPSCELQELHELVKNSVTYFCAKSETDPSTGTRQYQFFIKLHNYRHPNVVKRLFDPHVMQITALDANAFNELANKLKALPEYVEYGIYPDQHRIHLIRERELTCG